jgi:Protein of unknown function (DUF1569)
LHIEQHIKTRRQFAPPELPSRHEKEMIQSRSQRAPINLGLILLGTSHPFEKQPLLPPETNDTIVPVAYGGLRKAKTLSNPKDKEEIVRRIHAIHPNSQRRWGKMSLHQMVCHLSDAYRVFVSDKPVQPAPVPYPRGLLRWFALWVPLPWPRGFKAAPELDQQVGGTPLVQFEKDMRELHRLLDRVTRRPRDFEWQVHPHFGQMSEKDWMRLGYLHADHHLRQFGA